MALLIAAVATAIVLSLGSHRDRMIAAVRAMDSRWLVLALGIGVIHRVVNPLGWTMVLWAMGRPLPVRTGARIWLTSEAFRWLPGSVWAYGSRGVLAARAGIPPAVAAVSLLWELGITVLAWFLVAAVGLVCWTGPVPPAIEAARRSLTDRPGPVILVVGALGAAGFVIGSKPLRRKFAKFSAAGSNLRDVGVSCLGLGRVLVFHLTMVAANGLTFWLVVRASPGGDHCSVGVALAANSIAWLAGLFALFAPGGLVVREATIGVLLGGLMPVEQAVTVALAWRAIQVAAEVLGTVAIIPGRSTRVEVGWPKTRGLAGRIEA